MGDATLRYQIIQQRSNNFYIPRGVSADSDEFSRPVVSKRQVPIRVRLATSVEIPAASRQIYTQSLIKMNAVLKFNNEYFDHGIAPVSYDWSVNSARVVNLEIPTESGSGAGSLLHRSLKVRNNEKNDDLAVFTTSFNSSSVYVTAIKEGEAEVTVQVAIEYPSQYRSEANWLESHARLKVTPQLKIAVNDFSSSQQQDTHMFLLPPNAIGHIKANIDTKLKLGYSIVSVYDHTTKTTKNEEPSSPIVKLIDNRAIQTLDKYGKVTVIIEEGGQQFSDQVAMLNVFITDIYTMQVMDTYESLNLPLGSSVRLPIHFQNEHANRFADNIEGVPIGFSLSHPKVVQVLVDEQHQSVTLVSQGTGECNVRLFLQDRPGVFDVFKVKVSSLVRPYSPVQLHVGGKVEFRVVDKEYEDTPHVSWKSTEPSVLQIETQTGKAVGLSEGRAEILLSNHANAASIVQVSEVRHGQVEHKNALTINTDSTD